LVAACKNNSAKTGSVRKPADHGYRMGVLARTWLKVRDAWCGRDFPGRKREPQLAIVTPDLR